MTNIIVIRINYFTKVQTRNSSNKIYAISCIAILTIKIIVINWVWKLKYSYGKTNPKWGDTGGCWVIKRPSSLHRGVRQNI